MQIPLDVPEQYALEFDPRELGERIKLYAALLMFRAGELSAGAAVELAGVDRWAFAAACQQHGIPIVDYPEDDLASELDSLRHAS